MFQKDTESFLCRITEKNLQMPYRDVQNAISMDCFVQDSSPTTGHVLLYDMPSLPCFLSRCKVSGVVLRVFGVVLSFRLIPDRSSAGCYRQVWSVQHRFICCKFLRGETFHIHITLYFAMKLLTFPMGIVMTYHLLIGHSSICPPCVCFNICYQQILTMFAYDTLYDLIASTLSG